MRALLSLVLSLQVAGYRPAARSVRRSAVGSRIVCRQADPDDPWQKRWGNKSPEEIENMKKWAKILSTADTFDADYLDKQKAGQAPSASSNGAIGWIVTALVFLGGYALGDSSSLMSVDKLF